MSTDLYKLKDKTQEPERKWKQKLNAGVFRDRRMYIDENAAQILLDKYMRK